MDFYFIRYRSVSIFSQSPMGESFSEINILAESGSDKLYTTNISFFCLNYFVFITFCYTILILVSIGLWTNQSLSRKCEAGSRNRALHERQTPVFRLPFSDFPLKTRHQRAFHRTSKVQVSRTLRYNSPPTQSRASLQKRMPCPIKQTGSKKAPGR